MRWIALLLCLSPLVASAEASKMTVSVVSGSNAPKSYNYPVDADKHVLDLRAIHRYDAAFEDPATKRQICREGMYKTGLLLTLRALPKTADGSQPVEIIGQVSNFNGITPGKILKCGTNQEVSLSTTAFSDTIQVEKDRTKVVAIDGSYTIMVKVQ
ncbi:hypothetical protein [Pseudomonas sp. NPDC089569]|uniref:hypothetical protein n=1 Tax=Pseudomonas sp. NPDC089569 TaxID=3390722 RepID=UPI003D07FE02